MSWKALRRVVRSVVGPRPPRTRIVAAELARFRHPRYLEIGLGGGITFLRVRAARKVGVDPIIRPLLRWHRRVRPNALLRGSLVRTTSDEYFDALPPEERFEVVFIDGYHSFEQSRRDVENALDHLAAGGTVLVHDCNPPAEALASPSKPLAGGFWHGDVWKMIVLLRATRADLAVEVVDTRDGGVGVIRRRAPAPPPLGLDAAAVERMTYADLERDRERLLGLRRRNG